MALDKSNANKAARPSRKSEDGKENADGESKPTANTPQSRKRRASGDDDDNGNGAGFEASSVKEDECFSIEYDCDEIRDKIREHLEHNKVKITDFQQKLHVTPAEYKSFMGQTKGPGNGLKHKTCAAAHQFFTQLDSSAQNAKSPASKKQKTESKSDNSKGKDDNVADTADLPKLEGEDNGTAPIYDTCNDIRSKIEAHLKKHKLTKVAFAKEISKCQASSETAVTPKQISDFQRKNGPLAGNSSKAFYANYMYFEKLRIKEGKDKSKKRKEMEEMHGEKGVWTDRATGSVHFTMHSSERVHIDKHGKIQSSSGTW